MISREKSPPPLEKKHQQPTENWIFGVTKQLGLKLFRVGCPPGPENMGTSSKCGDLTGPDPGKVGLCLELGHSQPWVTQQEMLLCLVVFPMKPMWKIQAAVHVPIAGRFLTFQRWTWPCHPHVECAARSRWGAKRHPSRPADGQPPNRPLDAVVHAVNGPFKYPFFY